MARTHHTKSFARRDHYDEVTQTIIAALEQGTKPWRRPWTGDDIALALPINPTTGKRYRGVNVLLLSITAFMGGSHDPRFCSYKQAEAHGWQVRGGGRGTTVFFFKPIKVVDRDAAPDADDPTKSVPVLRAYTVFHASQIDGMPAYDALSAPAAPWRRPEAAEVILTYSGATVRYGGGRAFYSRTLDIIGMPEDRTFSGATGFATTLLHEMAHWSGAKSRLDRDLSGRFGSELYAREELRAELASAMIGAVLNLPSDIPNHADYVADWLAILRKDKREIFRAASDAQKIADYILGFHPDYAHEAEERGSTSDDDASARTDAPLMPESQDGTAEARCDPAERRQNDPHCMPHPLVHSWLGAQGAFQ